MKKIIFYLLTTLIVSSCFREDVMTIDTSGSSDTLSERTCPNDSIISPIIQVISDYMDNYTPIISPHTHKAVYTISFSKSINNKVFFELHSSNKVALIIDEEDNKFDIVGVFRYKGHLAAVYDYPNDSLNQILYSASLLDKDSFKYFIEEDRKKFSYDNDTMPIWIYKALYRDSAFTIERIDPFNIQE
jgi:hypothetical protein